jgi:hypothetical protein
MRSGPPAARSAPSATSCSKGEQPDGRRRVVAAARVHPGLGALHDERVRAGCERAVDLGDGGHRDAHLRARVPQPPHHRRRRAPEGERHDRRPGRPPGPPACRPTRRRAAAGRPSPARQGPRRPPRRRRRPLRLGSPGGPGAIRLTPNGRAVSHRVAATRSTRTGARRYPAPRNPSPPAWARDKEFKTAVEHLKGNAADRDKLLKASESALDRMKDPSKPFGKGEPSPDRRT